MSLLKLCRIFLRLQIGCFALSLGGSLRWRDSSASGEVTAHQHDWPLKESDSTKGEEGARMSDLPTDSELELKILQETNHYLDSGTLWGVESCGLYCTNKTNCSCVKRLIKVVGLNWCWFIKVKKSFPSGPDSADIHQKSPLLQVKLNVPAFIMSALKWTWILSNFNQRCKMEVQCKMPPDIMRLIHLSGPENHS